MKKFLTSSFFILTSSLLFAFGPGGMNPGGGGQQPGGGGNQPDIPGGGGGQPGGGVFTYDTFLTESTTNGGCIVYGNLMTGYVPGQTAIAVPASVTVIADGALAGNGEVTTVDATAATGLSSIPDSFAAGCGGLVDVDLSATVTAIGPSAFAMDASLELVHGEGVTEVAGSAFIGSPLAKLSTAVLCVVTFDANGGICETTAIKQEAGTTIASLPIPVRNGYDFIGWYTSAAGGTEIEDGAVLSADMTVYAHWERQATPTIPAGESVTIPAFDTTLTGSVTWSAKGLPTGMKIAAKNLTDKTLGSISAGMIYGTPTKPGTYVVTITAKSGSVKETFTEEIVIGNYVDDLIPVADCYGTYRVGTKTLIDLSAFSDCKVSGLPTGLKFATKAVTDSTLGAVAAGWIYGVPTKACTNTVTFTKTASELVDGKSKKVTHKATATFVVVGLPSWAVGTFNGLIDDGSGSATMTVSSVGKISGKIVTLGKTWSFSSSGFEAVDVNSETISALKLAITAKNGKLTRALDLLFGEEGVVGTFGDTQPLTLWRNAWKDSGATAALAPFVGVYTVQLASSETGTGYLSLTIDAKGNCKATGKLPDGTSASGTLPLIWDAATDAPFAVWLASPSAYKGGCVGGLLKWTSAGDAIEASLSAKKVIGEAISWVSYAPAATAAYGEGFSRTLAAQGAWYDKTESLSDYYSSLAFRAETPTLDVTVKTTTTNGTKRVTTSALQEAEANDVDCWTNLTVSLNAKGTAFVVDAGSATKPVQDKTTKAWTYDGANDAALTFAFTKATGIFKGTFTCWYDYVSATDMTKDPLKETVTHTYKKVSYEGIMVTGESLLGYYLWERTGTYVDASSGKAKSYKYKESRPIVFDD